MRQRLDQIRFQHGPAVTQALKVSVDGRALPPLGAFALAPVSDRDGRPARGGGASADPPNAFERWGFYVNGDIDIGRQSAVDTQSAFKVTSNGLTLGTDYRFEGNHVLGAALACSGPTPTSPTAAARTPRATAFRCTRSYVPVESAYIDAIVNASSNQYDGQRPLQAGGQATSSTDGGTSSPSPSARAGTSTGDRFTANPYLRVEYVDAKVNGFTESGSPDEALVLGEQRVKATTLTLGGQASYAIGTSWGVLVPYAKIELQHLAQSNAQDVTAQLAGVGSPSSIVPTLGPDRNFGNFAAGASGILANGFTCFFNYEQSFGKESFKGQKYTLGLRLEF